MLSNIDFIVMNLLLIKKKNINMILNVFNIYEFALTIKKIVLTSS